MTHPFPEGENLRAAVRFIAEKRKNDSGVNLVALVDAACMQFDLTPGEGEFLMKFVQGDRQ